MRKNTTLMAPFRAPVLVVLATALTACPPPEPEPTYDDELGITPISVDDGALLGTWGVKISISTVADFPAFGEVEAGGDTYYLTTRVYDDDTATYATTVSLCGGRTFETIAGSSTIPHASYQSVTVVDAPDTVVDHGRGTYEQHDLLELWALEDLPSPKDTPLPQNADEAAAAPHVDRITDADDDGQPGITSTLTGAIEGDVYFIQRRLVQLKNGLVVDADHLVGLVTHDTENITIGSSNPVINQSLEEVPAKDPKQTWFQEVRLDDDADCNTVLQAVDDGVISRLAPF